EALAIETARALQYDLPLPVIRHLIALYAEASPAIVRLMHERDELRQPVSPTVSTLGAEVVHVIRHEMAVRLSDIVIRRTGLGAAGHPGSDAIERCGGIAAAELGWDRTRLSEEVEAVELFYTLG